MESVTLKIDMDKKQMRKFRADLQKLSNLFGEVEKIISRLEAPDIQVITE